MHSPEKVPGQELVAPVGHRQMAALAPPGQSVLLVHVQRPLASQVPLGQSVSVAQLQASPIVMEGTPAPAGGVGGGGCRLPPASWKNFMLTLSRPLQPIVPAPDRPGPNT